MTDVATWWVAASALACLVVYTVGYAVGRRIGQGAGWMAALDWMREACEAPGEVYRYSGKTPGVTTYLTSLQVGEHHVLMHPAPLFDAEMRLAQPIVVEANVQVVAEMRFPLGIEGAPGLLALSLAPADSDVSAAVRGAS